MASIEAYHIAIGCFNQFIVSPNKVYPKCMNINFNHSSTKGDLSKIFPNLIKFTFFQVLLLFFSFNAFSVLLLSFHDEDVESNPGPNYTTEKKKRVISPG